MRTTLNRARGNQVGRTQPFNMRPRERRYRGTAHHTDGTFGALLKHCASPAAKAWGRTPHIPHALRYHGSN